MNAQQDTITNYVFAERSQLLLLHSLYSKDVTVADQIILSQHSEALKAELERRTDLVSIKVDTGLPKPFYLPTMDGKVIKVGGYGYKETKPPSAQAAARGY